MLKREEKKKKTAYIKESGAASRSIYLRTYKIAKKLAIQVLLSNIVQHHQQAIARRADRRNSRRVDERSSHAQNRPHGEQLDDFCLVWLRSCRFAVGGHL